MVALTPTACAIFRAETASAPPPAVLLTHGGRPRPDRAAARERGQIGQVVTLSRSLIVPFLTYCRDRALRETAFAAWTARGEHDGPHDNRPIMAETLRLRHPDSNVTMTFSAPVPF